MLQQAHHCLVVETRGPGFTDVTRRVAEWLQSIRAGDGLLTLFLRHTSASLTIQENADPDVLHDLSDALERAAPRAGRYRHRTEGPDDMPAHIKALGVGPGVTVPIRGGRLALGTWQGIYLGEHRDHGGARTVVVTLFGDGR